MDLNTVTAIARPHSRDQLPAWQAGDAWLAGGTWLYSEPQTHLTRLIDLAALNWPALTVTDTELQIAATCTVAQLDALACPPDWVAAPVINQCCRAFLASFKIWKSATIGGNLCMALPAGPMIALTAALDGVCTIWRADGSEARVSVADFVSGNQTTVLAPGELLRSITIPLAAFRRRTAFRQISLTPLGRSAALLIGSRAPEEWLLIVTAATRRPVRIAFAALPDQTTLAQAILQQIPDALYHDDVHGKPAWRKQMTLRLAEQIRVELQDIRP